MASSRKVRARSRKLASAVAATTQRVRDVLPLFEVSPLEQRVLMSVSAPGYLTASTPYPTFPPALANAHPMSQVTLSWTEPAGGDTPSSFNILQSKDGGATFKPVGTTGGGTGSFNYTVGGLMSGTTYLFDVEAVGSGGETATSEVKISTANNEYEYVSDFNSGDTSGWAGGGTWTIPPDSYMGFADVSGQKYLGNFKNQSVSLTMPDTPFHTNVLVFVDLFILNDWASGTIGVTVNNATAGVFDPTKGGNGQHGEIDHDGAEPTQCGPGDAGDSEYGLAFTVPETSSGTLTLTLTGSGITDEIPPEAVGSNVAQWGLRGAYVRIFAPAVPEPQCSCTAGGTPTVDDNSSGGDPMSNDNFGLGDGFGGSGNLDASGSGSSDVDPSTGSLNVNSTQLSDSNMGGLDVAQNWTSGAVFGGSHIVSPQQSFLSQEGGDTLVLTQAANIALYFDGSDAAGYTLRYGK